MGGIEFRDGALHVERDPNELDELALSFSTILGKLDIQHVFVAGYLSILTGRSRATEDIDTLVEPIDEPTAEQLVGRLEAADMWGPAMPLDRMHEVLAAGDPIWVAPDQQIIPHIEASIVDDEADWASLENAVTAHIGGETLPVGPIELQIAYKLFLGTQTDFEDAVHLHALFEETLSTQELEDWVNRLGVEDHYERLITP